MSAEKLLEKYIAEHPDYWEFENEAKVVAILKELCDNKNTDQNITTIQNRSQVLYFLGCLQDKI